MPSFLYTLPDGRHMEYSTVSNMPAGSTMDDGEIWVDHYDDADLDRLRMAGTSHPDVNYARKAVRDNVAGPGGKSLNLEELAWHYHPDRSPF